MNFRYVMSCRRFFSSKNVFKKDDPLLFESQLSSDELLIQKTAKTFAEHVLKPQVTSSFRNETWTRDLMYKMGSIGLLGANVTGFANHVSYGLIAREIERVDSGYRSILSVQSSLVMYPIHAFGTEFQKNKYLSRLESGEIIGCFGLTEPDHGSDPSGMISRAVLQPCGTHYILNGSKNWITNSPIADVLIIWAKDEKGILRGFILDRTMKGISTPSIKGKLSLRTSATGMIFMEDVKVPVEQVLNVTGFKGPFSCLNHARYGISWGVLGAAEDCYQKALLYSSQRKQFSTPLASKQLIQIKLVDMMSDIAFGLQNALRVGRLKDEDKVTPEMISMIKRSHTMKALSIARNARDILGGNGISDEYDIMRHMVNLEAVHTYEGTYDIHGLILGRVITGHSAF
jgi:glutaryl-CoA dehydrogenase